MMKAVHGLLVSATRAIQVSHGTRLGGKHIAISKALGLLTEAQTILAAELMKDLDEAHKRLDSMGAKAEVRTPRKVQTNER